MFIDFEERRRRMLEPFGDQYGFDSRNFLIKIEPNPGHRNSRIFNVEYKTSGNVDVKTSIILDKEDVCEKFVKFGVGELCKKVTSIRDSSTSDIHAMIMSYKIYPNSFTPKILNEMSRYLNERVFFFFLHNRFVHFPVEDFYGHGMVVSIDSLNKVYESGGSDA